MVVFDDIERYAGVVADAGQRREQALLARLGHAHPLRLEVREIGAQGVGEGRMLVLV